MTTGTNEIAEVSIDSLLSDSSTLDARTFLQRYRKHIQADAYIGNYYSNLTPETIDSNYELVKNRLREIKSESPNKIFGNAKPVTKTYTSSKSSAKPKNPNLREAPFKKVKSGRVERLSYVIQFLDSEGHIMETMGASDSGDSVHRANRRLALESNYAQAVYYSSDVLGKDGSPVRSVIEKKDAVASFYKKKGNQAMKVTSASSKLEWGGKAKNDHFHFSKG